MAKPDSTTTPSRRDPQTPRRDPLLAFLQVACAASERALNQSPSPKVRRLVERAHTDLADAHALLRSAADHDQAA